jgi:hypothetical protein
MLLVPREPQVMSVEHVYLVREWSRAGTICCVRAVRGHVRRIASHLIGAMPGSVSLALKTIKLGRG